MKNTITSALLCLAFAAFAQNNNPETSTLNYEDHFYAARNSNVESIDQKNFLIIGKWKIIKIKFPDQYFDASKSYNMMFFGSQTWADAEGKYFYFKEESVVITDIFLQNNEPIKLYYKSETKNNIRIALNENSNDKSFILKMDLINGNMIWRIDDVLEVTLIKELD